LIDAEYMIQSSVLVIGIGNGYRGDDAVGLIVARAIKAGNLPNVKVIEESGEGTALMERWKRADTVILIDAVSSGARPGTIHRFDVQAERLPTSFFHYSTHAFSIAEAIELGRALEQLPSRMIVYGIEGKRFESGEGLTQEIILASTTVTQKILYEIQSLS
jgi:hydrogenase maturation protease